MEGETVVAMAMVLIVFLALFVAGHFSVIHVSDFQRFVQVFFIIGCGMVFWFCRGSVFFLVERVFDGKKSALIALVLFILVFVGSLLSPSVGVSALEASYWISLAVLIFLTSFSISNWRECVVSWMVLGGFVCLLISAYGLMAVANIYAFQLLLQRGDVTPGLANIRLFSDLAVGLMPLAALYFVSRKEFSTFAFLLCFPGLMIWWWMLFLTEARSGVVGLIVSMLVAALLFGRQVKWPILVISMPAIPALAGWWLFNPLRDGLDALVTRDLMSSSGRVDLWLDAIRYGWESLPIGIGPMQFAGDGNIRSASAHNFFLNTAAEWGIPVSLFFLFLLVLGFWRIYERSKVMQDADKPVYSCLVMAFVGVMVNLQFAGAHLAPLSSIVMALSIGLVFGYKRTFMQSSSAHKEVGTLGPIFLWGFVMCSSLYLLIAGMALYELSLASAELCFEELGRQYYYPRFWAQGRLECMKMVDPDHWLFWGWKE